MRSINTTIKPVFSTTLTNPQADRRGIVYAIAETAHKGQVRKYTGEAYITHCVAVETVLIENVVFITEAQVLAALLHDVVEDCGISPRQLLFYLTDITSITGNNISNTFASEIVGLVVELTDVYTKEDYPELNRKERKILEAKRLSTVSYEAQTIKYADLIDNTKSIVEHDKRFAKVYLKEKETILNLMGGGDKFLYLRCRDTLQRAFDSLNGVNQ